MTNDSIIEVIGFTHKSIYVLNKLTFKKNNVDTTVTYPKNVFGYGYISGNSCMISDIRLMSNDKTLFLNRLKKVTLHEMGHNFGLEHCRDTNCIMSETNGNILNLNRIGGDYCEKCRKKLK
jgi:archaemetzincin